MAYTPELSYRGSATLGRLACFRGKPVKRHWRRYLKQPAERWQRLDPERSVQS